MGSNGKKTIVQKIGDGLERMGEKLREKGPSKLGDALYRTGNRIEHSEDK